MATEPTSTEPPRRQKALGSLGPVDVWIRRTALLCGLLVVTKVIFLFASHAWGHAHFAFEAWPGFFEAVGFLGFALLVVAGRILAPWVRRPEAYYDPELALPTDEGEA